MLYSMKQAQKRKMESSIREPCAKRLKHIVKYGKVSGENRGEEKKLIDPPIEKIDYYYWLRDSTRTNDDVLKYLKEENDYCESIMSDTKDLQNKIYNEILSRIIENKMSYPIKHNKNSKYLYFDQLIEKITYKKYFRKAADIEPELLLDVNKLVKNENEFCDVVNVEPNFDDTILAYSVDFKGNENYTINFIDLKTKELLNMSLKDIYQGYYVWHPHENSMFHIKSDDSDRACELWYFNLDKKSNKLLFEESNMLFSIHIEKSTDNKYFFIKSSSYDTDMIYFFDLEKSFEDSPKIKLFTPKKNSLKYNIFSHENDFIIITNRDDAVNNKLMCVSKENTDYENWRELIKYDKNTYIMNGICYKNFMVLLIRKDAFKKIGIVDFKDCKIKYINFSDKIYDIRLRDICDYDTNIVKFEYESFIQSELLYEFNIETKELKVIHNESINNFDPKLYNIELIHVPSYYGEMVPMSIVYRKDIKNFKEKPLPLYLYGYGSYGSSCEPLFSPNLICLLDRHFICVIAHVRGGGELGGQWFLDGKLHNKMNTFLDFITCAEYLIRNKYTEPNLLAIEGRSAGGLLTGACMTLRPDLFKVVIAGVPFLDVLTTMSDSTIPLTTEEWILVGNSNVKEDYVYMKQYSPYDNIKNVEYPHCLLTAGLNDNRVLYWEAAKFIAKLRHMKTDKNIHLLKTNMNQGHFSTSNRYNFIKEKAFVFSFILKMFDMIS